MMCIWFFALGTKLRVVINCSVGVFKCTRRNPLCSFARRLLTQFTVVSVDLYGGYISLNCKERALLWQWTKWWLLPRDMWSNMLASKINAGWIHNYILTIPFLLHFYCKYIPVTDIAGIANSIVEKKRLISFSQKSWIQFRSF